MVGSGGHVADLQGLQLRLGVGQLALLGLDVARLLLLLRLDLRNNMRTQLSFVQAAASFL